MAGKLRRRHNELLVLDILGLPVSLLLFTLPRVFPIVSLDCVIPVCAYAMSHEGTGSTLPWMKMRTTRIFGKSGLKVESPPILLA